MKAFILETVWDLLGVLPTIAFVCVVDYFTDIPTETIMFGAVLGLIAVRT